jgi:hypothetical protein
MFNKKNLFRLERDGIKYEKQILREFRKKSDFLETLESQSQFK